jgi:outer membrane protein OmpA-like peptidoglycan-associated protein
MRKLVVLSSVLTLAACSSPPTLPVVDGSNRQAVNTSQSIKEEWLRVEETRRRAEESRKAARAEALVPRSHTFSVYFSHNSATFRLSEEESGQLLSLLAKARRIEVRGRTDGQRASAADEKIALNRALAAQRFLIGQGVSPAIISVNYVSAGDYVADNFSAVGRSLNRRVDIEVFNQ